ncbi:hypothetical protein BABINDRAFT_167626 [Babjeviella inositovora NRRL Y-12698]|uniref:Globin domain-containing protein n=1 Tax=Babjeviella inositovora NRRL Y-12698 TaxID=984486 RepID=A0A1E3QPT4_9ASCO|nr:uncharacterized protein BABINDRAFT_167626 [Babjeviella inositovora NRRL Y-12698]ODQ79082.1 hypothetical protein BABINDRAFT_167626 [Babjeviella inositovora NRRL Y-12698]
MSSIAQRTANFLNPFQQLDAMAMKRAPSVYSVKSTTTLNHTEQTQIDSAKTSTYQIKLQMSAEEIQIVRSTWVTMLSDEAFEGPSARPDSDMTAQNLSKSVFVDQIYSNLLTMKPDLEKLFPSIKHQAASFAGVLAFAISQLEDISRINAYLMGLGKLHSRILGIEKPHFELMGYAFIKTCEERFGTDKFTPEMEKLWISLYLYLANTLIQFGLDPYMHSNFDNQGLNDAILVDTQIPGDSFGLVPSRSMDEEADTASTNSDFSRLSLLNRSPPSSHNSGGFRSSISTIGTTMFNKHGGVVNASIPVKNGLPGTEAVYDTEASLAPATVVKSGTKNGLRTSKLGRRSRGPNGDDSNCTIM